MNNNMRSTDLIESKLIFFILDGKYSPGNYLPSERELAKELGVGRPTLREAIQRLQRDGWFTVNKGHPTMVNDFWKKGNLNTLVNVVQNKDKIPDEFIIYLLEIRANLTPTYMKEAIINYPAKVVALLSDLDSLEDTPNDYAVFDWELQKKLAALSSNPLYLLFLNSFDEIYVKMALRYFAIHESRRTSAEFYQQLLSAAMSENADLAEQIALQTMIKSIALWKKRMEVV